MIRLLFDQNLSRHPRTILRDVYPCSIHVQNIRRRIRGDFDIWTYAKECGYVVVTKDRDFVILSRQLGHPPKVIRLRCGNCPTSEVADLLREEYDSLLALYNDEEESFTQIG